MLRISVMIALVIALACGGQKCLAQRGEATFGIQTGYTSTNSSALAGLFFQYNLSGRLRIAPQAGCVFRNEGLDAFQADVNLHFPLKFTPDRAQLYPIVGLDFSSWTRHNEVEERDATNRYSRLGGNAGIGFQFKPTSSLKLKAEGVYTVMKQYSTFAITFGIGYIF
ncbi:MAG: outer membrane beta-barrel protein [Lachnospiraceae bacterium]|nr:outer membrane beta-barrel protein [Lachnospiraceae bacterium]